MNVTQAVSVLRSPTAAPELLLSTAFSAASQTITFPANKYKKIDVFLDTDNGGITTVAMTGLDPATYETAWNATGSTGGGAPGGNNAANNWTTNISGTRTTAEFSFKTPPAPAKKALRFSGTYIFGGNVFQVSGSGDSTDVTHDPTAIVITFDAVRAGYIYALGYV
jgi:hypothetical protein